MGDSRKPQFSKEKRFFPPTPSPVRRVTYRGTFVLILGFVLITSIPPANGASSLYLPSIINTLPLSVIRFLLRLVIREIMSKSCSALPEMTILPNMALGVMHSIR